MTRRADIDNRELERVKRDAKRDEEWEVRARQIEDEEQNLHHLKVEQAKAEKEKRAFKDKTLDNEELMRVQREQKEAYEEEQRARARESEQNTIKDMAKKEKDEEKEKRLLADKCEYMGIHTSLFLALSLSLLFLSLSLSLWVCSCVCTYRGRRPTHRTTPQYT